MNAFACPAGLYPLVPSAYWAAMPSRAAWTATGQSFVRALSALRSTLFRMSQPAVKRLLPQTLSPETTAETGAAEALRPAAAPGPVASFVRFVVLGGGVTLLSSAALVVLQPRMNLLVANAIISVLGTLLATELHGRLTFRSDRRGWRMHGESALTAVAAYLVTSTAMLVLHAVQPHPPVLLDQTVYLAASAAAGLGRFLVLRLRVFARRGTPREEIVLAA